MGPCKIDIGTTFGKPCVCVCVLEITFIVVVDRKLQFTLGFHSSQD